MKFLVAEMAAVALVSLTFAASASAQAKADIARGQQIASTVCAACHGADGNSLASANPHLAGQGEQYIASQLAAFKSGARPNPVMAGMAAGLAAEDMKALGVYFASQKLTKSALPHDKKLAEEGQKIFRAGNRKLDIPACAGCHGATGSGIPAQYPRLSGQWPEYTLQALQAYASEQRKHSVMGAIAKRMTEPQMKAVAEYIAGMR